MRKFIGKYAQHQLWWKVSYETRPIASADPIGCSGANMAHQIGLVFIPHLNQSPVVGCWQGGSVYLRPSLTC